MTRPARLTGLAPAVLTSSMASRPGARPDAARRGSGAHARVPSLAVLDERGRGHRSCLSAAVRDGYEQRRPPSRASSSQDGSSRAIAASFSFGLDRPGTPRAWGRLSRRPRRRRASRQLRAPGLQRRAGLRGAVWRDERAPRSPADFFEGGRAGWSLVAVCGPRSRSARGRRARHAACRDGCT